MGNSHIGSALLSSLFLLLLLNKAQSVAVKGNVIAQKPSETLYPNDLEDEDFPDDEIYETYGAPLPDRRIVQESDSLITDVYSDVYTRFLDAIVGVLRREGLDDDDIQAFFHMLQEGQIDIEHLAARKRRSIASSTAAPINRTDSDGQDNSATLLRKTKSQPIKSELKKGKTKLHKPLSIRKKSIDWNDYPAFEKRSALLPVGPGWKRQSISRIEQALDTEAGMAAALEALGTYENRDNQLGRFIEQQSVKQVHDAFPKRGRQLMKRRPQQHDKQRMARPPTSKQQKHRTKFNAEQCPLMKRIVSNCNSAEVLMGGYRQLLIDACLRYEACSLCERNHDICDRNYRRHSVALCGPDLLCRAQSQRVAWGLGDIHDVVDDISGANFGGHPEVNCQNDPCVARLLRET